MISDYLTLLKKAYEDLDIKFKEVILNAMQR